MSNAHWPCSIGGSGDLAASELVNAGVIKLLR